LYRIYSVSLIWLKVLTQLSFTLSLSNGVVVNKFRHFDLRKKYQITLRTYLLACLLACCMDQSPSWEANRFWTGQEILCILWNPKVYFYIHKRPPPVPILSQLNLVQTPHPTSWKPILILCSHLRLDLPNGLLNSSFPTKHLYAPLLTPHVLHAPPISFFSFWSPKQYLVRSTDH
jgi:hypothetical protein